MAAVQTRTPEARLLVVDDEPNIVELLSASLRFAGFEVATAMRGEEAVATARTFRPDLVVLDVMMPGMDGFGVVKRLRGDGDRTPVLFLTARDATEDKVTGLTLGGDDYVTKPFSLEEVVARIRAILRRNGTAAVGPTPARLTFADIELDDDSHEVWKAGKSVSLSPTEFKLLRYLMSNPGRVLSKALILDHVWNYDFGGDANVVESYISYLRRKIDTTEPRLLHTLRGVGYVLRVPPDVIGWVRRLPHRIVRAIADAPLRMQLVGAVLVLVLAALATSGIAGTRLLRNYLVGRTDSQLHALSSQAINDPRQLSMSLRNGCQTSLGTSPFYLASTGYPGITCNPTQQRLDPPTPSDATISSHPNDSFTVTSENGSKWRLRTVTEGSNTLVVGTPLDEVNRTVSQLARYDVFVSGIVLVLLVGFGGLIVQASLRRLREIEQTAAAIADGDLSRRVPVGSTTNEVGRLSLALNGMLTQIESAFHDREASEANARTSEERMRRFVADASHELRTPLTSIRGFAELYRQGAVNPGADLDRIMGRVEDEANRMGLLVEDLLLLARLDQQRPLEQHPVDVLTIATDAVHDAHAVQPDRQIRLDVDGATPAIVLGDEARLRQVAGNLVTNALAHTPPEAAVTIRVATTEGPAPEAVLSVIDDGPGLAPQDAERVFERFYRADASRTRIVGGSGLGLSIVAALVAAHGGQVRVHTAPGKGAAFEVRLPLLRSAADQPAGVSG